MSTNRVSPFLDETLASLLAQTYKRWTLTVVADGCPNPASLTAAIERVPGCRVLQQPHRGLPAARNTGFRHTRAPLVALLDDDDIWDPSKLEDQVAALARHPDALAAFTAGRYIDGHGTVFGEGWPADSVDSRRFISGEVPPPRIVTLMVRRSAHELIGGFNETYSLAEDNEYILRLAIAGHLVGVAAPLVSYRRHDGNMSTFGSIEGRRANLRLLKEQLALHKTNPNIGPLLRRHIATFKQGAAQEWGLSIADAVRRRRGSRILNELWWAMSVAPRDTLKEFASKIIRIH